MKYAGLDTSAFPTDVSVTGDNCLISTNSNVSTGSNVVLEEFAFTPDTSTPDTSDQVDQLADWLVANAFPKGDEYDYWRNRLKGHLVILPDDAFRDFVSNSTQITTHIKIDNGTKTVATGALWTKESLPADTMMVSTVIARQSRRKGHEDSATDVMNFISGSISDRVQLAGDESTGNGVVALKWFK
jgi:CRISPR-associated protein Cmr4